MDRVTAIREKLLQALQPESLEITDDSHLHAGHAGAAGGAGHYSVHIVSSRFQGRTTLERHRLVYQALSDMMPGEIHALSIRAQLPEQKKPEERQT